MVQQKHCFDTLQKSPWIFHLIQVVVVQLLFSLFRPSTMYSLSSAKRRERLFKSDSTHCNDRCQR